MISNYSVYLIHRFKGFAFGNWIDWRKHALKVYLVRHGQTDYNKQRLLQGRSNISLNSVGRNQATEISHSLSNVKFDAVYASPLIRAIETAAIISGVDEAEIVKDERIIEVDFGIYEKRKYTRMGFWLTLYWLLPEVFRNPKTVEGTSEMVERVVSFLNDLKKEKYENVLVVCHGGIIRVLSGCLEGRKNGLKWRPKPKNCEIRVYEL